MAQKSITSFFTVQKKKSDDTPQVNVSVTKEKSPEKKCEERGSSKSPEPAEDEVRKSGRQKVKKGAAALREIEEKRAAKRAKLSSAQESSEVKSEEKTSDAVPASEEKDEKMEETAGEERDEKMEESAEGEETADASEAEADKTQEPDSDTEVNKSREKSQSPKKSPSPKPQSESPAKAVYAGVTSDFSDAEEEVKEKTKPTKTSAKKPAAKPKATKKKSPAASKPKSSTSQAIASFFAPKTKKTEETSPSKTGTSGEKTSPSKATVKPSADANVMEYNPAKNKYHVIDDATWQKGKPVPYLALARTLECIEDTSARLRITEILSNFLRSVIVLSPDNLLQCVYLCLNKLAPAFEGLELGLAERSLMKAVAQSSGRSEKQVLEDTEESGDLGIVAQNSCGRQAKLFRPPPLTVPAVFNQLKTVASMKGRDSMTRKLDKVVAMYNACKPIEARYLIRSLAGKLRIGLAEQTVLQAIALACVTTPPGQEYPPPILNAAQGISVEAFKAKLDEQALILKTTYCECPVYDKIIPMLLEHGIEELPKKCKISPGIPLRPMLAHPTKGVNEVLTRFDGRRFTCEWKYDGERAQVHISGKGATVRIFSRNQEDNTSKFPEVVTRLADQLAEDVTECILDCEAVGWDRETNRILPFQILSTRKKKDANEADIKVQVCLFVFDLLYVNGEALVKVPLGERRRRLKEVVKEVPGQLQLAESLDTDSLEEVQAYLEQSVKGNCEGLMVKTLEEEATYEIAKRSRNWLKLKKDYLEGVGDTLDLVILGGYLGRGKRAGVYGGFLLGCYDPETEEYQSICKIGTGFSDEALQTHSDFFKQHVLSSGPRPYYRYDPSLAPDHWFDAVQVWEVKCADLSLSPVHKAATGIVDPEKGISLRFPRFLRIRDDKKVEEATSAAQVAELYQNQDQVKNQAESKVATEDDFY